MKNFFRGLFSFVAILFVLVALVAVALFIYAPYYFSPASPTACSTYYMGVKKGIIWEGGEWHHYVDVAVDIQEPSYNWEIIQQPLPSSVWQEDPSPYYKRIGYEWPDNWWDPFPAKTWRICLINS